MRFEACFELILLEEIAVRIKRRKKAAVQRTLFLRSLELPMHSILFPFRDHRSILQTELKKRRHQPGILRAVVQRHASACWRLCSNPELAHIPGSVEPLLPAPHHQRNTPRDLHGVVLAITILISLYNETQTSCGTSGICSSRAGI